MHGTADVVNPATGSTYDDILPGLVPGWTRTRPSDHAHHRAAGLPAPDGAGHRGTRPSRPRTAHRWGQSWRRMTGRLGNVRPISANPAAANMVHVPVKSADPLTLVAVNLSTSTG